MSRPLAAARAPLAAALLAPLPFLACLGWGFIAWDDPQVITANPLVRGDLAGSPAAAFSAFHMATWQPLTWLFFAALDAAGGGSPLPWRLASLGLHALNAGLLAAWLARLLEAAPRAPGARDARAWAAAAAALAWAWHPLQAESVAWASQAGDLLGASCVLAALLARESGRPGAGLLLFALAGGFRWKALAYPVFTLARDLLLPAPRGAGGRAERAGLLALSAGLIVVNARAKATLGFAPSFFPHEALAGLLWQARKVLRPWGLAPDAHFEGDDNPLGLGLVATLAVWGALGAATVWARARARALLAAGGAFLLAIAPTVAANAGAPAPLYDHHLYLPLAAFAAPLAARLAAPSPARAAAAAALLALGVGAAAQARHWRGHEALWTRVLAVHPEARRAGHNFAAGLAQEKRWGEALLVVDEHLARLPGDAGSRELRRLILLHGGGEGPAGEARVQADAATVLFERGRAAAALERLARARSLAPRDPELWLNTAIIEGALGRRREARATLKAALRLAPRHTGALEALRRLDAAEAGAPR